MLYRLPTYMWPPLPLRFQHFSSPSADSCSDLHGATSRVSKHTTALCFSELVNVSSWRHLVLSTCSIMHTHTYMQLYTVYSTLQYYSCTLKLQWVCDVYLKEVCDIYCIFPLSPKMPLSLRVLKFTRMPFSNPQKMCVIWTFYFGRKPSGCYRLLF